METFIISLKWPLIIFQILVSLLLVIAVLLQSGKSDDLGSALGGGGSGSSTVLGTGGTSRFLVRLTTILAVLFMVNSVGLAKIFKQTSLSVTEGLEAPLTPAEGLPIPGEVPAETPAEGFGSPETEPEGDDAAPSNP